MQELQLQQKICELYAEVKNCSKLDSTLSKGAPNMFSVISSMFHVEKVVCFLDNNSTTNKMLKREDSEILREKFISCFLHAAVNIVDSLDSFNAVNIQSNIVCMKHILHILEELTRCESVN